MIKSLLKTIIIQKMMLFELLFVHLSMLIGV